MKLSHCPFDAQDQDNFLKDLFFKEYTKDDAQMKTESHHNLPAPLKINLMIKTIVKIVQFNDTNETCKSERCI